MDLISVLNKVNSFTGVTGYVIVDNESNIVHTSLEREDAITLAAIVIKVKRLNTDIIIDGCGWKRSSS